MMEREALNLLIKLIATVVAIVLTTYVIPWIKSFLNATQLEKIREYTIVAVRCAEQIYTVEEWKEKKQYVYDYILEKVNSIGLEMDERDIDILIEGIVNEIKHKPK